MIYIAIFFAIIVAFIFIPIRIRILIHTLDGKNIIDFSLSWVFVKKGALFGFGFNIAENQIFYLLFLEKKVRFKIQKSKESSDKKISDKVKKEKSPEEIELNKQNQKKRIKKFLSARNLYLRPAVEFLKNLRKCFELKDFTVDFEYGLSSPAKTGQMYGWYWALYPLHPKNIDYTITPNFQKKATNVKLFIALNFLIYYLIWLVIVFVSKVARNWLGQKFPFLQRELVTNESRISSKSERKS
jgi:hypothetical protein